MRYSSFFIYYWLISSIRQQAAAEPVKVSVYYETLCSDSRNFFIGQLYPVYQDLKDIMALDVNAYGKASVSSDSFFPTKLENLLLFIIKKLG